MVPRDTTRRPRLFAAIEVTRSTPLRPTVSACATKPGTIRIDDGVRCVVVQQGSEMSSVRSILRLGAAALAAAAFAGSAHAVDIHVGSYVQTSIGSEFTTPYDTFRFVGDTVTVAASPAPAVVTLGSYSFEVGPNCYSCTLTPSFDAWIDLTIDGVTQQFDLPFAWHSAGPSDFLTFSKPNPVTFDFDSLGLVTIAIDAPPPLSSSGATIYGQMTATVTTTPVPEPTTFALFVSGLGAIGFIVRRRS